MLEVELSFAINGDNGRGAQWYANREHEHNDWLLSQVYKGEEEGGPIYFDLMPNSTQNESKQESFT